MSIWDCLGFVSQDGRFKKYLSKLSRISSLSLSCIEYTAIVVPPYKYG